MIAVDTNVLVRLLVNDDPRQTAAARRLIEQSVTAGEKVLVMLGAVLETEWVLRSRYRFDRFQITAAMTQLLKTHGLAIEHEPTVEEALSNWDLHPAADFTDCLLSAHAMQMGASSFFTFDRRASQLPGATPLQ